MVWYRDKLKSMEEHMTMMEQMIEDNERRFEHEMIKERARSKSLEDRLHQDEDGRRSSELKVRELDLRENGNLTLLWNDVLRLPLRPLESYSRALWI